MLCLVLFSRTWEIDTWVGCLHPLGLTWVTGNLPRDDDVPLIADGGTYIVATSSAQLLFSSFSPSPHTQPKTGRKLHEDIVASRTYLLPDPLSIFCASLSFFSFLRSFRHSLAFRPRLGDINKLAPLVTLGRFLLCLSLSNKIPVPKCLL